MILLIIALCFLILGYFGTVIIAWQSISRRTPITYMAIVFICLGALGAIWIVIDSSRSSELLQKKTEEVAILNQEISNNQKELRNKSDEIAELNRVSTATITGGDSFCYVVLFPTSPRIINIVVINEGSYPMYDVDIRIVDLKKFNQIVNDIENRNIPASIDTFSAFEKADTNIHIGNLPPKMATKRKMLFEKPVNFNNVDFNIFISARNGSFTELLRIRNVNDTWKRAFKVFKTGNKEVILKESVDPGFPQGVDGQIEWE